MDFFKNQYDCCSEWSFDIEDSALLSDEPQEESSDDEYRYHLPRGPAPPHTAPPVNLSDEFRATKPLARLPPLF